MATIYDVKVPNSPGVPEELEVPITVMRGDGEALSREELEALAAAYPPPTAEGRAAVDRAIARAPSRAPNASTKPRKATSKRAAAKRPSR